MTRQIPTDNDPLSPLAFTRAYQQYRNTAARTPFADSRLLMAARFWGEYPKALGAGAFTTYWREDLPPLLAGADADVLADLTAEEVEEVAAFVERSTAVVAESVGDRLQAGEIWELAARQWFYLGQADRALDALMKAGVCAVPSGQELAGVLEDSGSYDAGETPALLTKHLEHDYPDLARWLKSFAASWGAVSESGEPNSAQCLLVEYDANGRPVRGRLRRLKGKIEERGKRADTDEVIFHHQLKSPDDPFVGTVYNALVALRQMANSRGAKAGRRHFRGRFEITGEDSETYTGNSVGLAAFAVAYGAWWNSEVHRERRLIGRSVAFTGAIGEGGEIQPIAEESLTLKVDRAFRSPLTHLIVPEANRKAAESVAEALRKEYPPRRLYIVGIERTADVIADHNIFRPERVCMGEFVVRKATRYSRSVKVQVPALLLLAYLLVCLMEPRAWILFDWNPQYVKLTETGFVAMNVDSIPLWSVQYQCESLDPRSTWKIGDLDGDGKNEVAFVPKATATSPCESNANLYVYDHKGRQLFQRQCAIPGEYPGDNSLEQPYTPEDIDFLQIADGTVIITRVYRSYPARLHLRFWNAMGDSLGWYINAGFSGARGQNFLCKRRSEMVFLSFNNRMDCACLFALDPDSSFGVSPPYTDPEYDLEDIRPGNQICHVLFPRSDVNRATHTQYNSPNGLFIEPDNGLRVDVIEASGKAPAGGLSYYLDSDFRVVNVKADDCFFTVYRDRLVKEGKLPAVDRSEYLAKMRHSVKYWADSGWVTEGQLRAAETNVKK